jgi:hypothetical protein
VARCASQCIAVTRLNDAKRWAPFGSLALCAAAVYGPSLGVVDVLLMYLLADRCFRHAGVAFAIGLALLFAPAHIFYIQSLAVDDIWCLPVTLWWAVAVTALFEPPSPGTRWVLASGIGALPMSAIREPSALLMLPIWIAVTVLMFRHSGLWQWRDVVPSAVALVVGMALWVWASAASATTLGQFRRFLDTADMRNMFVAARALGLCWDFFRPSHLFLTPSAPGFSGMFLTPFVVPILVGIHALAIRRGEPRAGIDRMIPAIVAGCVGGPLSAAMSGDVTDVSSLLTVPFGLLLAAYGASVMRGWGRIPWRASFAALCLIATIQAGALLGHGR